MRVRGEGSMCDSALGRVPPPTDAAMLMQRRYPKSLIVPLFIKDSALPNTFDHLALIPNSC